MISMTGYARSEIRIKNSSFTIYIKSLNSQKGLDFSIKTPRYLMQLEHKIKSIIEQELIRGKVEVKITENHTEKKDLINQKDIADSISVLKKISPGSDAGSLLNAAIVYSGLSKSTQNKIDLKFQKLFLQNIMSTVKNVVKFRVKEGKALAPVIKRYLSLIQRTNKKLIRLEKQRKSRKKISLVEQIRLLQDDIKYNKNRLEAEMIYYFEKYDISEERIRLDCHCNYFLEILNKEKIMGKKLIFLSQEILREINTIGSKANDFEIQKLVIEMKENIDKIKEQLYNIL